MLPSSHLHNIPNEHMILENDIIKEEFLRIMVQTLENFGYMNTAKKLIEESRIKLGNEQQDFKENILKGNWDKAINLLGCLGLVPENISKAIFFIYEQQYIELIIEKNYEQAIVLMRQQLSKYCTETDKLHILASFLICKTTEEVHQKLGKVSTIHELRMQLLKNIQSCCRPQNMIEANRMNKLLHDSICYQVLNCKWHLDTNQNYSLLENHQCQLDPLPTKSIQTLKDHTDEVWLVKFAPDAQHFASIAKNSDIIVWKFDNDTHQAKLKYKKEKAHDKEINCLNWSLDSKRMATCSVDKKIKLWDFEKGEVIKILSGHIDIVFAVVFLPGTLYLISGGIDEYLILWNKRGDQVDKIKYNRVMDIITSEKDNIVYTINAGNHRIGVIDLNKKMEIAQINEKDVIISAVVSKDGKYMIINTSYRSPELHLWDLRKYQLVQKYTGHHQEKFMIRCIFGGCEEKFIACGGEDAKIKLWHRNVQSPISVLVGHVLTVNSIAWHPKNSRILISGSDDHTVKIWASDDIVENLKDHMQVEEEKSMSNDLIEESEKNLEELPHLFEDDEDPEEF